MARSWTAPTLPKATVEDPNDPVLGWDVQLDHGPNHLQGYAPWVASRKFVTAADIVDPTNAPTTAAATTGGTLTAAGGPFVYAYSWGTAKSETKVSPAAAGQAVTGSTAKVTVTVPTLPTWADRTYVYRQVSGNLLLVGTTAGTTFVDDGSVTPYGFGPQTTTGGTAVLKEVMH